MPDLLRESAEAGTGARSRAGRGADRRASRGQGDRDDRPGAPARRLDQRSDQGGADAGAERRRHREPGEGLDRGARSARLVWATWLRTITWAAMQRPANAAKTNISAIEVAKTSGRQVSVDQAPSTIGAARRPEDRRPGAVGDAAEPEPKASAAVADRPARPPRGRRRRRARRRRARRRRRQRQPGEDQQAQGGRDEGAEPVALGLRVTAGRDPAARSKPSSRRPRSGRGDDQAGAGPKIAASTPASSGPLMKIDLDRDRVERVGGRSSAGGISSVQRWRTMPPIGIEPAPARKLAAGQRHRPGARLAERDLGAEGDRDQQRAEDDDRTGAATIDEAREQRPGDPDADRVGAGDQARLAEGAGLSRGRRGSGRSHPCRSGSAPAR